MLPASWLARTATDDKTRLENREQNWTEEQPDDPEEVDAADAADQDDDGVQSRSSLDDNRSEVVVYQRKDRGTEDQQDRRAEQFAERESGTASDQNHSRSELRRIESTSARIVIRGNQSTRTPIHVEILHFTLSMVETEQVARSKAIQKRTGTTFYVATKLLPARVRHPTYVLYAFFRCADEVVDAADGSPPAVQRAELERLRARALGDVETDHPILTAFQEVRDTHDIADEDINAFIDAMLTDIETRRYATYEELEAYMRGSAAAVGQMMTSVMDPDEPGLAKPHARALGEAFQLSNFCRDVREDVVDHDRIYLPQSTLTTYGVTPEQVERLEMSPGFARAIQHELRRAESLYERGVAGIEYLPVDCRLPVLTAAVLYADYHRLIRAHDCDVLTNEPELSTRRMLSLAARVRWHWYWSPEPERVFERVSSISSSAAAATTPLERLLPAR